MAAKKTTTTKKSTVTSADLKDVKADVKLAHAEAIKARAEAAKAKAASLGGTPIGGFINFIREKGVVGLAVGLAIGTAATGVVTQIVNAVITPTVSLLLGQNGLKGLNFVVRRAADGTPTVTYAVGDLIDALIKFIAVAAVIYFVVMGLKLDRLDKKKED
jgi:large conductance mechanosensitive channel